jgi:hypothetical protein
MKVQKKMADCGNVMPDHGLRLLAVLLAAMTLLLLVAGALVTSNEAGDSVPDWPLSFGRWLIQSSIFVGDLDGSYRLASLRRGCISAQTRSRNARSAVLPGLSGSLILHGAAEISI